MMTMAREQLDDLIWSILTRDAAAEIDISDVGLEKVCERHRGPVPPQGYWNKVHAPSRSRIPVSREFTVENGVVPPVVV